MQSAAPALPACEESLRALERRGYAVRRVGGFSQIDVGRSKMATDALRDGFEETLWVDSDLGFSPDEVDKLRARQLPIVCGVYAKKGYRSLACNVIPGTKQLNFGVKGGLVELLYAAAGFMLVRRQVYLDIQEQLHLPLCNEIHRQEMIPYFLPMLREFKDGHWYLGEDYAFCERARQVGYKVMAETSVRLWHIGYYSYGWEDAGRDVERFGDYRFFVTD